MKHGRIWIPVFLALAAACAPSAPETGHELPPVSDRAKIEAIISRARLPARTIDFVRSGDRIHPRLADAALTTTLPAHANGIVRVADVKSGVAVRVVRVGATNAGAATIDGLIVYRGAMLGGDVVQRVTEEGTEDYVAIERRPAVERLSYEVELENAAGLRLVSNILEVLDADGAPRVRVPAPYVIDANGRGHDAALSIDGCRVDTSPVAPWSRPVVAPGAASCRMHVSWAGVSYPLIVDPGWVTTAGMTRARGGPALALLDSGKVLIVGGVGGRNGISTITTKPAELFDPATRTFAGTGELVGGGVINLIRLPTGKVLVATPKETSSEMYDPATGMFAAIGPQQLSAGAVTLLPNGKVLLAAGTALETYDPVSNAFTIGRTVRFGSSTVVPLGGAKVLFAGGRDSNDNFIGSADVYDGDTDALTPTAGSLRVPRASALGTRLGDGRVLLVNGQTTGFVDPRSAEIFDPATSKFTDAPPLPKTAGGNTLRTLLSGRALLCCGGPDAPAASTFFDPVAAKFEIGPSISAPRQLYNTIVLANGQVLIAGAGGYDSGIDTTVGQNTAQVLDLTLNGGACKKANECASGQCVDNVCCDTGCSGACETCRAAGKVGTCTPFPQGDFGDPACTPYRCDGKSGVCPATCSSDADCARQAICSPEKTCVSSGTCDGDHTIKELDGTTKDCGAYKCSRAACITTCTSVADCVAPNACDDKGACVPVAGSEDDGGCSVGSSTSTTGTLLGIVLIAGMNVIVRRRRARGERRGL